MQNETLRLECLKILSNRPIQNVEQMINMAKSLEEYVLGTSASAEPAEATPKKVAKQGKNGNSDLLG